MKRILSLVLIGIMAVTLLAGCGEKKDRILYSEFNLEKNVTIPEYKGVKVDTSSKEFKEYYDNEIVNDIQNNNLYVKKTDGKVADGDTVNIDYVGKKDGVAFEGGTANGYNLTIGSNTFIEGFEDGLIDKAIGSTVDLNLTFPTDYQSQELAGKAVVFTVKINYATTKEERKPEDYFKELDFKSLEEYEKDVRERAIDNYLMQTFLDGSKVNKYSQEDQDYLVDAYFDAIDENLQNQYGTTLDEYLKTAGQTKESLKEAALTEQITPTMDTQMPIYTLIDKEGIEITKEDINNRINKIVEEYGSTEITAEDLKEYYGEYYFENLIATEKALEVIRDNAEIK